MPARVAPPAPRAHVARLAPAGPPGAPAPAVLTSGQTVTGLVAAEYDARTGGDQEAEPVTFRVPAAVAPRTVTVGMRDGCKGPGQAPPGVLCLYQDSANNAAPSAVNLSSLGFVFLIASQDVGDSYWFGTFAYTQP